MKILLFSLFWTDGYVNSTRERNVKYVWLKIKELNDYFINNGINSECKLYDFSPNKLISDSIHIPYELGVYKKSEKLNKILSLNNTYDYIMMFDSDCFFIRKDYDRLVDIIKNLKRNEFVTFDCAKLFESDVDEILKTDNVDLDKTDWWFALSGEKNNGPLANGLKGNLGGVFIIKYEFLIAIGFFDEKFVTWGNEDCEIMTRIYDSRIIFEQIPIRDIFPFHLPHLIDLDNKNYMS